MPGASPRAKEADRTRVGIFLFLLIIRAFCVQIINTMIMESNSIAAAGDYDDESLSRSLPELIAIGWLMVLVLFCCCCCCKGFGRMYCFARASLRYTGKLRTTRERNWIPVGEEREPDGDEFLND